MEADPLSVAASAAGIATVSVQLSQTIYALISTFSEAEKEMSNIANDLSLLAMILSKLEFVLRRGLQVYRWRMVIVVDEMLRNCHDIFQDISKHVSVDPCDMKSSKQLQRRIGWYFQDRLAGPLHATLESMNSTLNVILHVVSLARAIEEADVFMPNAGTTFAHADIQKERRALIGVVLDNRRSIMALKKIEEDRDGRQNIVNGIEAKHGLDGTDRDIGPDDSVSTCEHSTERGKMTSSQAIRSAEEKKGKGMKEGKTQKETQMGSTNRRPRQIALDPKILARSASYSLNMSDNMLSTGPEPGLTDEADELFDPSMSQQSSLSQSPTLECFETPPEISVTENTVSHHSQEDVFTDRNTFQRGSEKELATKLFSGQGSSSNGNVMTPNSQWFLSIVPHESCATTLVVRPRSKQAERLRARAEATAKTLVLTWTILDPDYIFENDSVAWSRTTSFDSYNPGQARDSQNSTRPYQLPFPPQQYPTYATQQWYRPPVYTLPPSTETLHNPPPANPSSPPPLPEEKQTDTEELARLKKLILDEKAEQDMRAATLPFVSPIAKEESQKDSMRRKATCKEAVDSSPVLQEHSAPWKVEHPRVQPVIMRDWLGRKFIFPVDMCQTWEGLHNLIDGAFGHDLEYRSMVEKGKYLISQATGEYILPSTWEWFVKPGLEISMEMPVYDADRSPSSSGKDISPEKRTNKMTSPKQATKSEAEMKYERTRRLHRLKQELADQSAAIQALEENSADGAEQGNSKLHHVAWLEKRVRDQREELDRVSPVLLTPPGSSAGDSSSPQRKASLGARLLDRIPTRSIRSRRTPPEID